MLQRNSESSSEIFGMITSVMSKVHVLILSSTLLLKGGGKKRKKKEERRGKKT